MANDLGDVLPDPDPPPTTDRILTIPNLISLGRLVLTPVLGWLIISEKTVIATVLFGLMGISDWVDGQIARRTNTVTDLGTTLDPVSDRVLVMHEGRIAGSLNRDELSEHAILSLAVGQPETAGPAP